tara:strand:- start:1467 stop:1820 length:354 start_codon:yes stop_codon:yes gene_type:complete
LPHIAAFIAPVPTDKKDDYLAIARQLGPLFRKYGALRYVECWGTDVPDGKLTSFPMAVKKEDDETVVLSWIEWPDKATADAGWENMQQDEAMMDLMQQAPLDGKRMIFAGFDLALDM